jgi:hypothetical protein
METPIDEALSSITDVLRAGQGEKFMRQAIGNVPREVLEPYMPTIVSLNRSFRSVEPSSQFVRRLHAELKAQQPVSLMERVKVMPPRVQAAAGTFAVLGFGLIVLRWIAGFLAQRSSRTQPDIAS